MLTKCLLLSDSYNFDGLHSKSVVEIKNLEIVYTDYMEQTRGVLDQHFQNPAGTGFTGSLTWNIGPDFRPLPDFSIIKKFQDSLQGMYSEKNEENSFINIPSSLPVF